MKLLFQVALSLLLISNSLQIATESKHKLSTFSLDINVDYNQATETMNQLKILKADYQGLKQKIVQKLFYQIAYCQYFVFFSETKDYSQCLDFVVALQCQKMDIWQAAIQELEIENKNAQEVQIPFLQHRKTSKVEKLKELLEITSQSDLEKEKISSELENNRKKIQGAVDILNEVYQVSPKTEFVQRFSNQMKDLSALEIKHHIQNTASLIQMNSRQDTQEGADVDELNEQVDAELSSAHLQYLEKDQQIQAQTTVNVIKSSESKINEALNFLTQSFDSKLKELKLEKQQLKEDIEQLRTQLQEFEDKVKRNQGKVEELQGKVKSCENKPQNKEHDCDPIKERAKKDLIEVEMMLNRIGLIEEQINSLMEGKDQISQGSSEEEQKRKQMLQEQLEGDKKVQEILQKKAPQPSDPEFSKQGAYRDVGAEAVGDNASRKLDDYNSDDLDETSEGPVNAPAEAQTTVKQQAGMQLEDRNQEYKFRKGTIEYDGHYIKDLKGYKQYDD